MNYHEVAKQWFVKFGECCKSRDFESAKNLVSSDVCSFGTKVDLVTNLNDLETQQWQNIWPYIENFEFLVDKLIADGNNELIWGVTPWNSIGYDADGNSFDRPGRATVILKDFYNEEELELIWEELKFYTKPGKLFEAKDYGGIPDKTNSHAILLNSLYGNKQYRTISNIHQTILFS